MRQFNHIASAAILLSSLTLVNPAAAQSRLEVGTLTCGVEGGVGLVFGSTKDVSCEFDSIGGGPNERYTGYINKYGLDLGVTGNKTVVWAVLAPTTDLGAGSLNGTYTGASGSASVGVGLGGKILVGGSSQTFALQPISVQAQTGINIAITVAELNLRSTGFAKSVSFTPSYELCSGSIYFASGDTLSEIAGRCATSVDALLEANPGIRNVRDIPNGTEIRLPRRAARETGSRCGSHAVSKSGDDLGTIGQRCGVSFGALIDANPRVDRFAPLTAGRTINIPVNSTTIVRRRCGARVTIRKGDTLNAIGDRCGVRVDALLDANPRIKNVRDLQIGNRVRIPAFAASTSPTVCGSHAIVKPDEDIITISRRCGVSVGAILDFNPKIQRLRRVEAGTTVNLPAYSVAGVAQ